MKRRYLQSKLRRVAVGLFVLLAVQVAHLQAADVYDLGWQSMKRWRVVLKPGETAELKVFYQGSPCSIDSLGAYKTILSERETIVFFRGEIRAHTGVLSLQRAGEVGSIENALRAGEDEPQEANDEAYFEKIIEVRNPGPGRLFVSVYHPDFAEFLVVNRDSFAVE